MSQTWKEFMKDISKEVQCNMDAYADEQFNRYVNECTDVTPVSTLLTASYSVNDTHHYICTGGGESGNVAPTLTQPITYTGSPAFPHNMITAVITPASTAIRICDDNGNVSVEIDRDGNVSLGNLSIDDASLQFWDKVAAIGGEWNTRLLNEKEKVKHLDKQLDQMTKTIQQLTQSGVVECVSTPASANYWTSNITEAAESLFSDRITMAEAVSSCDMTFDGIYPSTGQIFSLKIPSFPDTTSAEITEEDPVIAYERAMKFIR